MGAGTDCQYFSRFCDFSRFSDCLEFRDLLDVVICLILSVGADFRYSAFFFVFLILCVLFDLAFFFSGRQGGFPVLSGS